ncbi:912_t:CDS:2, partial [Gigaspora margarita]
QHLHIYGDTDSTKFKEAFKDGGFGIVPQEREKLDNRGQLQTKY